MTDPTTAPDDGADPAALDTAAQNRRGLSFQDLADLDQPASTAPDPAQALTGPISHPLVIAWHQPDPITVLGVARALTARRNLSPAVLDADGQITRLLAQEPAATTAQLATAADHLRDQPGQSITPTNGITLVRLTGTGPELIKATALLLRSYETVLLPRWDDTAAGIADVVVLPMTWTEQSVRGTAATIHDWHRSGEPIANRLVIAAHTDPADPGLETRARRWFTQVPVCPLPTDPAARTPGLDWHDLHITAQNAYATLAGQIIDLANRQYQ
mgnify:FL=1